MNILHLISVLKYNEKASDIKKIVICYIIVMFFLLQSITELEREKNYIENETVLYRSYNYNCFIV